MCICLWAPPLCKQAAEEDRKKKHSESCDVCSELLLLSVTDRRSRETLCHWNSSDSSFYPVWLLSFCWSLTVTLLFSLWRTHSHLCSFSRSQAHMQSGIVPSHHPAPTHPPMMLMATQGPPAGPQPPMPQTALNPIPVSSTTHFSYLAHPQGIFIIFLPL